MSSRLNILKAEKLKIDIKNMGVNKKMFLEKEYLIKDTVKTVIL